MPQSPPLADMIPSRSTPCVASGCIYAQACYEVRAVAERLWTPLAARFFTLTLILTLIYAQACYEVRAVAERLWAPLAARAKDYIAAPKPNGYRSLHATLRVPGVTVDLRACGGASAGAGAEPAGGSAASAYGYAGSAADMDSMSGSGGGSVHSSADWAYRSADGGAQVASASGSTCVGAAAPGGDAARLHSSSDTSSSAGHGQALLASRERGGSEASSSSDSELLGAQQHRHMSGIIGEGTHGGGSSSGLSREESAEAQETASPHAGTHDDAEGISLELQIRTRGALMSGVQSGHSCCAGVHRVVTDVTALTIITLPKCGSGLPCLCVCVWHKP